MPERVLSLEYPHAGLNRRFAIQRPPKFSTLSCLNVRPFDPIEERQRGGNRPGLAKYPFEQVGDSPVNMLACINVSAGQSDTRANFVASFDQADRAGWNFQGLSASAGFGLILGPSVSLGRTTHALPSTLNSLKAYTTRVRVPGILRPGQLVIDGIVSLDFGVVETAGPQPLDHRWSRISLMGVYTESNRNQFLQLIFERMRGENVLERVWDDSVNFQRDSLANTTLSVTFNPFDNSVSFNVRSAARQYDLTAPDGFTMGVLDGEYAGIALKRGFSEFPFSPRVQFFALNYSVLNPPVFPQPDCLLAAASGGVLKIQKADGVVTPTPARTVSQKIKPLMAVDMIAPIGGTGADPPTTVDREPGIRLFIADYGDDDVVPKVYDPATNVLQDWVEDIDFATGAPKGRVPLGNHIMARFGGRIYLAGKPAHAWAACRLGDPFDWDFGKNVFEGGEDPAAAIGGQAAELSVISEPLTALPAFTDDYLIFGTANKTHRLAGDPGFGARVVVVSTQAGFAGPQAWCPTPEGAMIFMDQERGLFILGPGAQSFPEPLSANVLPRELRDIDTRDVIVTLAYDHRQPGVHIVLTSVSGQQLEHFWYDRRSGGFWPFTLSDEHLPSSVLSYQSVSPDRSGVLFGGHDGFIWHFNDPDPRDDGVPFEQFVVYGPFNLAGGNFIEGVLRWIRATIPTVGDGLRFEVMTGPTAESAIDDNSSLQRRFSGAFGDHPMLQKSVRLRGVVAFVKIIGGGSAWAMETMDVGVEPMSAPRP